jgi:acylphosphatase
LTFLSYINVFEKLKMKAVYIIVSGLVQGVGFRYFVVRKARELGLNGFVKNRYEGDVEIVAEGNLGMLNQFIEELKVGSISSDVRDVKVEWIGLTGTFNGFHVRF